MQGIILGLIGMVFYSIPIYVLFKLIECMYKGENKTIKLLKQDWIECIYTIVIFIMCITGLMLTYEGVKAGEPLSIYEIGGGYLNEYTSLSLDHMLTVWTFFILGIASYLILKSKSDKLSPVVYTLCSSILVLNIIFTIAYYLHTKGIHKKPVMDLGFGVLFLKLDFIYLSIMYVVELKNSLDKFIENQRSLDREYKNKFLNILYNLCIRYQTMPMRLKIY